MKTAKPKSQPTPIESVDMEELEAILEASRSGPLDAEQHRKLKAAIETLAYLTGELESRGTTLAKLRKLLFGPSSEKSEKVLKGQPNDLEREDSGKLAEAERPKKKKPRGHGRLGARDYPGAERIEIPHPELCPGDSCPIPGCRGRLYRLAQPATLVRIRGGNPFSVTVYEREQVRCNLCLVIFTAPLPEGVGEKKYDESSASMISLLKYGSGQPFNRLERLERNLGTPLPAATQWEVVRDAAGPIAPALEELIRRAAQGELLHNDDTGMKILEHMGRRRKKKQAQAKRKGKRTSKSKERQGVFTSGIVSVADGRKIVLFFTGRQHAGENLGDVLARRASELETPIQMCDALSRNVPSDFETILSNCLPHGRRQFVDVAENFPGECQRVLETLREVFHNDALTRKQELSPAERLAYHRAHSRPLMVKLRLWFRKELGAKRIEPNSGLGKAIAYMTNHWYPLTRFYRYPGAPISNNVCERALKRAIQHRKNSLFYRSDNGARVGDLYMSLIYTAELNGANPLDYLTEIQRHAQELSVDPAAWMPWNYRETLARLAQNH